jgi:hypothetical protein
MECYYSFLFLFFLIWGNKISLNFRVIDNISIKDFGKPEDDIFKQRLKLWHPDQYIAFTFFGDGFDIGYDFEF